MMKKVATLIGFCFLLSCGEKLIEEPANLIPRDKMVLILKDMSILNAAKGINIGMLKDNGIDPTNYVFNKYEIDSAQFVESNRYYASLPLEYEAIYTEIDEIIEKEKTEIMELKKISDSLNLLERQSKKEANKTIKTSDDSKSPSPK